MTPEKFDRYMIKIGAGRNKKFVGFSDSEVRAHFLGVLSVAAQAPLRGYLLVTESVEAGAAEVANEAGGGVTIKVAEAALVKLKALAILERHEDVGAWYVHDWDEINPAPRVDSTGAERKRRQRERARGHADVTPMSRVTDRDGHADVTHTEVEVEVEVPANAGSTRKRATRRVDQSVPPEGFPADKLPSLEAVLAVLRGAHDLRGGIAPEPRGVGLGMQRNLNADHEAVARKLVHWLTAGKGQRAKCADIAARFGDWVSEEPNAAPQGSVIPFRGGGESVSDLLRAINGDDAA